MLAMAIHIGRKRLLVAWHGPAPLVSRRPALFWSTATATFTLLLSVVILLPGNDIGPNVIGMRVIAAAALAMLTAAAATGVPYRRAR